MSTWGTSGHIGKATCSNFEFVVYLKILLDLVKVWITHNFIMDNIENVIPEPKVARSGGLAFEVTLKEAEGHSPFKQIENKEPLSEQQITRKQAKAEERRLSLKSIKIQKEQEICEAKEQKLVEHQKRQQEEVEARRKQLEDDLILKEQKRHALLIAKRQNVGKDLRKAQEIKEKVAEAEEIKKKLLEEELQADHDVKEQNRLRLLEEKRNNMASELKRAQEIKARVMSEAENKRKKREEEIMADLNIKEANRAKAIEERLQTIQKRAAKSMDGSGDGVGVE